MGVKPEAGFIRAALRRVVPFGVRRRLLNILRGGDCAELPADAFHFTPTTAYDLLIFPVIDWNYLFQRPQQLVTRFARAGHRCFYVHTTFHQSGSRSFVRRMSGNVYGVRLPGPRPLRSLYEGEIDGRMLESAMNALKDLREAAGSDNAISLVQLPFWAPLAFAAREMWGWPIVYDCLDDFYGFAGNKAAMLQHEAALVGEADLVTTTGSRLFEKTARRARRTLMLPNAADFEHFSYAGSGPSPLAGLARPVVGYYGAVSRWFDVEMLRSAAVARPEWQFVIVGDYFDVDVRPLTRLSNVHLLSRKPYSILPAYLHGFDVAVIPFLSTPLTEATNPVKFYEYLSAGKPVVAAGLPELAPFGDLFYPVQTRDDFVRQIETALAEQSPERTYARVEFARQNTWLDRFRTLSKVLYELAGLSEGNRLENGHQSSAG